jgi:hypothetical protein
MGKAEDAARRRLPLASEAISWQDLKNAEAQRKEDLKRQVRAEIGLVLRRLEAIGFDGAILDQRGRFRRDRAYWPIKVETKYVSLYSDGTIPDLEQLRIGELNELLNHLKAGPPFPIG